MENKNNENEMDTEEMIELFQRELEALKNQKCKKKKNIIITRKKIFTQKSSTNPCYKLSS
jgi:hypothetical protein